jgi:UDP-GlcNAc:undecaprenyl-phosphate GlcNAc-1-phosphate transferase
VGLFDDVREMKPWVKLVSQIFVGIVLVSSGVRITLFLPYPFFGGLLTVLWVVGISNAFNLLDNMDGLSCGVGFIAAAVLFAVTLQTGQVFVGLMLVLFLGATLGFLRFNFSPASVFMGDAGSLFIGYMLSLLTVMATFYTAASPTLIPVIMPFLILSVPIFDTLSVVYLRIKQKKPVF